MKKSRLRYFLKLFGRGLLGLLVLLIFLIVTLGLTVQGPGAKETPAGLLRNESLYLAMDDGVRLAADIWYPADLEAYQQVPTVLLSTRYWRVQQPGFLSRALMGLGLIEGVNYSVRDAFNEAGYAYVLVDARGSGASEGRRIVEWSSDELADMGQVVDWIVAQPWSNGQVAGYGVSYDGNTAELLAASRRPSVKAVLPLYDRFDPILELARPGGVLNESFIREWRDANAVRDAGLRCPPEAANALNCYLLKLLINPLKPVDADENGRQLEEILAARNNPFDVLKAVGDAQFLDDELAPGFTPASISPYGLQEAIESSGAPMYVWAAWLDAGSVNGALSRFMTFENPQALIIGPWSHGGGDHADPFLPEETPVEPPEDEQTAMLVRFLDDRLKKGLPVDPQITYYTMGSGEWQTTDSWPPPGFENRRYYFSPGGRLVTDKPDDPDGADRYTIDFTATTGEQTRWHTPLSGDVVYPDRAEEDLKLLTYTSELLPAAVEITGNPLVTLFVSSTAGDGAFHVYLEDVAPDGRVTYITEGILRARHRLISEETPPYTLFGPYHSYLREDARPLVPGEIAELSFDLFATSARFEAGHRLRIAIAGHDAGIFERIPAQGTPTITLHRDPVHASFIDLPMK